MCQPRCPTGRWIPDHYSRDCWAVIPMPPHTQLLDTLRALYLISVHIVCRMRFLLGGKRHFFRVVNFSNLANWPKNQCIYVSTQTMTMSSTGQSPSTLPRNYNTLTKSNTNPSSVVVTMKIIVSVLQMTPPLPNLAPMVVTKHRSHGPVTKAENEKD